MTGDFLVRGFESRPVRHAIALVALALIALPGCVTRTLTIESDPPGAEVQLDGRPVGTTPYQETFLSYGVRRVDLRLPGHERTVETMDVERPWWQYFPVSLFADLFVPVPLEDRHAFRFELTAIGESGPNWNDPTVVAERYRRLRKQLGETLASRAQP